MSQTLTWTGSDSEIWDDANNWQPANVPTVGDTAIVGSGTALITGLTISGVQITLGAPARDGTPALDLDGATLANTTTIVSDDGHPSALLIIRPGSEIDGEIYAGAGYGTFEVGLRGRLLTLGTTALVEATNRDNISLGTGTLLNNGTLLADDGVISDGGATIIGSGSILLEHGGEFTAGPSIANTQTVAFLDGTGLVRVADPNSFNAPITGLQAGDVIDLSGIVADHASYNDGTLTASLNGTVVATLAVTLAGGPIDLTVRPDRADGTLILTSHATRIWQGGTADWYSGTNWTTGSDGSDSYPLAGDTARITSGTATISAQESQLYGPLQANRIVLNGSAAAPATLQASFVEFGSETSIYVAGDKHFGVLDLIGNSRIDGDVEVVSRAGGLTINVESNGTDAHLVIPVSSGAITAGAESSVTFNGGTISNDGLITANGVVNLGSTAVLDGSGLVNIIGNGKFVVQGAVNGEQVQFNDPTGELILQNLPGFQGYITGFQQGDAIDVANTLVQLGTYNSGTLQLLNNSGSQIAALNISLADAGTFVATSDGNGGTLIRDVMTDPVIVQASIPVAAVGNATDMVSLEQILINAFGTIPAGYLSFTLSPSLTDSITRHGDPDESYWGQPQQDPASSGVDPAWYVNGARVSDTTSVTVPASDIGNVQFLVGNGIVSTAWFQVTVASQPGGAPAEVVQYNMWSVAPAVDTYQPGVTVPDQASELNSIATYASIYTNVQNYNNCDYIADNVAAGLGATMPTEDYSTDPDGNVSGGFWRIVHNGVDDPISDWGTLVEPGDVVRLGWQGSEPGSYAGQHTTTVYQVEVDSHGSLYLEVYDNMEYLNDGDVSYIGLHDATYWGDTLPESITIYRLDPNHQYLIQGTTLGEYIQGSVFNNLIQPDGGADTIAAGVGSNEIQGTTSQLNGITITDLHAGDWLDFTDLSIEGAAVTYDPNADQLFVSSNGHVVATIAATVPGGTSFTISSDLGSGSRVDVACFAEGTRIRTPHGEVPIETLVEGDEVITVDGETLPIVWLAHRLVRCGQHPRPDQVWPVRVQPGAFAEGSPTRALYLSPDHAILFDDVLIPIKYLMNGHSVTQVPVASVRYFHLELPRHAVIWAEGLTSESYLEVGHRDRFDNGGRVAQLHPDFATLNWEARGCAPLVVHGPRLEAARAALAGRLRRLAPLTRRSMGRGRPGARD